MVHWAEQTVSSLSFWNMLYSMMGELKKRHIVGVDRGEWLTATCPSPFTPRKRALSTHRKEGCVGPRVSQGHFGGQKISFP
jgi:hypothetical protein